MKLNVAIFVVGLVVLAGAYDPEDKEIETIIPEPGTFEAFYPRETNGISNSVARASHNHGSYFQHRNPGNKHSERFNIPTKHFLFSSIFYFSSDRC